MFISYASEDAEAAQKICEAMGAATISLLSFEIGRGSDLGHVCDRILAMQKAASSSLQTQREQPPIMGDREQESQRGGTPT